MSQARLLCIVLSALLSSCTNYPEEPSLDNPLDPEGPNGGDPFELSVEFEGRGMRLEWNDISGRYPDLTGYRIYADTDGTVDEGDFRTSTGIGDGTVLRLLDSGYSRDATNYYKIAAERGSEISDLETVPIVQAYAPPSARQSNGQFTSPRPDVRLRLLPVVGNGDVFELSRTSDFAVLSSFTSNALPIDFDLGSATSSGEEFLLHSRVRYGGGASTSPVGVDTVTAELSLRMEPLVFGGLTDTMVIVDVRSLDGVEQMRYATSQSELAAQPWSVPDSTVMAIPIHLDPGSLVHVVYGEFESSFGFLELHNTPEIVAVDSVGTAAFVLESGAPTTSVTAIQITGILAAGAGYMRFSEDVSFAGVPWQHFASPAAFELSPTPGEKTVYGQFLNPFVPSDIESSLDTIVLLGSDPHPD